MNNELPRAVTIQGVKFPINWDYRAALDIMEVLADPNLTNQERGFLALGFFYKRVKELPKEWYSEAIERLFWFLRAGEPEPKNQKRPKLMDWQQDFRFIVPPVSKTIGRDIREPKPLHWWTFLSAYMEIGDCTFAQIVSIRKKLAEHQKLDKAESRYLRENPEIIHLRRPEKHETTETDIFAVWR